MKKGKEKEKEKEKEGRGRGKEVKDLHGPFDAQRLKIGETSRTLALRGYIQPPIGSGAGKMEVKNRHATWSLGLADVM